MFHRLLSLTLFTLFMLALPSAAHADAKTCAMSHASGQREAKAGRLRLATQLFTACGSDETCPQQIRTECTEMLETVRSTIPTVIFAVRGEDGEDVSNVSVFSTDELVTKQLDGRAVEMDPGKHRLRFLMPWGEVLSNDVLVREGEKNRLVEVKLQKEEAGETAAPAPAPAAAQPEPARVAPESSPPVAAWIATGAAVAGFGTFGAFAIIGNGQKSDLERCAPSCSDAERAKYDQMKTSFLVADVGLGVGVAATAVAAVLFATSGGAREERVSRRPQRRTQVSANPTSNGATVLVTGSF